MTGNTSVLGSRHSIAAGVTLALASVTGLVATVCFASLYRHSGGPPPTVGEIQRAYELAAKAAGELHDKDLRIVGVDCHSAVGRRRWCQIEFVKEAADPVRVFLDTALIEHRSPEGWILLRGLCRGLRTPIASTEVLD